ncbi:hypothetical protein C5612_15375 [Pseudomonas frederiksbergensis]|uniref:Uncharacterized protein n=1 Tax=Pseudomonas frederiksbergensis TaxID=104087 RepID=A0A2S8HLB3_9PSED|nr:hypothetical protein C5612_15375 [Pseudomonas frederiksbergensis]
MSALPETPPIPLWERACSRRRCITRHQCWVIHRLREQARSHIGLVSMPGFRATKRPPCREPCCSSVRLTCSDKSGRRSLPAPPR